MRENLPAEGLCVIALEKRFDGVPALDGLSLAIGRGEVVGLFGRDGAGKTLCFEAIMGLTAVDAGQIQLDGQDITALTIDRRAPLGLSYLPQETSIFRGMSVAENISAVLELVEPERERRRERLDALLAEFAIDYVRDTPAPRLSGGERRRCEIARAMASSPSIMLLDEPFAGIDPLSVTSISNAIARLKGMDVGVLISDQNVRETIRIIDRAYVIHQGRTIFEGAPMQMLTDAEVHRLYLGDEPL